LKKKTLALLLALVLLAGGVIGGTLAWLTDKTDPVKNTFTTSDIDISLAESQNLNLKMVPGLEITKDPKATVSTGSEECYLFVKLEKSANFDNFMTYTIADGWTELTGVSGVYYRKVLTAEMGTAYSVLAGDKVSVKGTVTKAMMNGLTAETYPTLTVTAYASQLYKNNAEEFTPLEAWNNIQPSP
jgi:predicted ribosomally synthesized peptide with SipW-like signal peptide